MPLLAEARSIVASGIEIGTPILVPSFSSKGFPELGAIVTSVEDVIAEGVLISAYDVYYGHLDHPVGFPEVAFLDSGGYEAWKDHDESDVYRTPHLPQLWREEFHSQVLAEFWRYEVPTVLVSYDHPRVRRPLRDQVERARAREPSNARAAYELLVKPEPRTSFVPVNAILRQPDLLAGFDLIGFTDNELADSIFDRMLAIARIRQALDQAGVDCPIHVLGSLDAVSSPLYFLAGADVFDGLAWLRYLFAEGRALYKLPHAARFFGIDRNRRVLDELMWRHNIRYLTELALQMRGFLERRDFACFEHNEAFFRDAYLKLATELNGG